MKTRYRCLAAAVPILITAAAAGLSAPEAPVAPSRYEVRIVHGITYARSPEAARGAPKGLLLLDLYAPASPEPPASKPAVLLMHGGSLRYGDRAMENIAGLCRSLAARGYVCASIEYRLKGFELPDEEALAIAAQDAAAALSWLVDEAGRLGVDPDRIALGGFSAGASIALFLAYGQAGHGLPIRAVVEFWGGMHHDRRARIEPGGPPLLIIQGTIDDQASYARALLIGEKMKAVGNRCLLVPVPGAGHNPPLDTVVDGGTLEQWIAGFLQEET